MIRSVYCVSAHLQRKYVHLRASKPTQSHSHFLSRKTQKEKLLSQLSDSEAKLDKAQVKEYYLVYFTSSVDDVAACKKP